MLFEPTHLPFFRDSAFGEFGLRAEGCFLAMPALLAQYESPRLLDGEIV